MGSTNPIQRAQRVALIRQRLETAFHPKLLEVIDESHLHAGHPGARDGRGHFRVRIVSGAFEGQSRMSSHRQVYGALGDLLKTDIHAIKIEVIAEK